ncbi:pectin lyase-like protein [Hypoxylon cercidicola]|nr:pectin lyase-like protein [Hypoxylon cercidicola]
MSNLKNGRIVRGGFNNNQTLHIVSNFTAGQNTKRQDSGYWLANLGPLGSQPLAGSGYQFFRNVRDDYGADSSGGSDAAEAINAAISDGNRCGEECGNTFTQGAIIYFPGGTYKICTPIIQLYYTQFIGDPLDPPIIQGCDTFKGIALIDTDVYIPGGSGAEWFVNQNQFFRHIRNFVFDLTQMPMATDDNDQPLVPTGIHWQVAQATTLQNLVFNMPQATSDDEVTAVGIFTENGSGGFVSDLTFNGGNIGWRAGSQQFTVNHVTFNRCLTSVQMIWDWGWVWQGIEITGGAIGFNISGVGGDDGQGIGSVSIIDSTISNVPVGILTNNKATAPDIVLDNVVVDGVAQVVQVEDGDTLLSSSGRIDLWATGRVYNGSTASVITGAATAPAKAASLLSNGNLYVQSRPQFETYGASQFSVATRDGGCSNDGTGDQTECINTFLQNAVSSQLIAYFPAGIYQVGGTVLIPTGSRVQGSSWSQIQGTGYYFSDMANPKVMVQVGNPGDIGTIEIIEMLFSVRGNTAGAILMEWNVAASEQGAAAMWDSHFRVGGGDGTDLGFDDCPKRSFNDQCIAASLMFHVTKEASGYFENVWAWVADHDNDKSTYNNPDTMSNQVSVYGARGMLIESQGPSWFYGSGSEHSVMYNYQLSGAKDIYMGHIQTETPYYQPEPIAPHPFDLAASFANDPDFSRCNAGDIGCAASWGLRVVDSSSVTIHGAGLYSFFQDYYQDCIETHDCQQRILEVTGSTSVVIFNLFTVATSRIAMGIDNTVVFQNDSNQRGFTTEDSIWLPLDGADNIDTIFVGTPIWTSTTVTCSDSSCLLVFPTSSLSSSSTITPSPYTTSFQYGETSTVTVNGVVTVTFITTTTTTVLTIPPVTIGGLPYSNYNITSGQSTINVSPSVNIPAITIGLPDGSGSTTSRVIPLPPWPQIDEGPEGTFTSPEPTGSNGGISSTYYTGITSTVTVTGSTVTTISFPADIPPTTVTCPPDSSIVFATPAVTVLTDCTTPTTWAIGFDCPTTKVVTFLAPTTGLVSVDCSLVTLWTGAPTTTPPTTTSSTTTPLPVWTTWPPGVIYPITTTVSGPEPTDGGSKQPCTLWFFFICISHDDIHIGGWFWSFPPGIYPPGPPPSIEWPPGFTLSGTLPPWPPITIGPNYQLTYSSEPTESCTTKTASICSTTTIYSVTSSDTFTSTTATSTASDCEPVVGCDASYSNTGTVTTTVETCTVPPTGAARVRSADPSPTGTANGDFPIIKHRADCVDVGVVVYPRDPMNVGSIEANLQNDFHDQIWSTRLGYTAYFWVQSLPAETKALLDNNPDVLSMYDYFAWNSNNPAPGLPIFGLGSGDMSPAIFGREYLHDEYQSPSQDLSRNGSRVDTPEADKTQPWKRAATSAVAGDYWNDALVSLPPSQRWKSRQRVPRGGVNDDGEFVYFYDDSAGSGVTVYAIGEVDVWTNHPEFAGRTAPRAMPLQSRYGTLAVTNDIAAHHGTTVSAAISGAMLGVCKGCSVVFSGHGLPQDDNYNVRDWYLEDLLSAWDDMNTPPRTPASSVINISWGSKYIYFTPVFIRTMYDILKRMDRAGVTIVVAAGNWAFTRDSSGSLRTAIDTYPQLFADPNNPQSRLWRNDQDSSDLGYLPNMIIVGATNQFGKQARFSQTASFLTTYAAGASLWTTSQMAYETDSGTSFAAPEVAALAAYFKQLSSNWHDQLNQANTNGPRAVKAMIVALQRNIDASPVVSGTSVPVIWNGIDEGVNCLLDFPNGGDPNNVCPDLPPDITDYVPPSTCASIELAEGAAMMASSNDTLLFKRQSGGSCTIPPNGGGTTISFTTGPAVGPTCVNPTACGGVVCSGYWCGPTPTGYPPGYQDPKDPSSSGATPSGTTITSGFPPGGGTTTSSTSSLPTLTPTSCPRPWSTTTVCNGSGGNTACLPSSVCPPPSSIPTATGTPMCPEPGQVCLATTTYERCERPSLPPRHVADASALQTQAPQLVHGARSVTGPDLSMVTSAPEPEPGVGKTKRSYELQVGPRQDGGGCPSGCDCFLACRLCATPTRFPCLDLSIIGSGDFFYNIWDGHVIEDGVTVCTASFTCEDCQGLDDWTDCGGGNSWKFTGNEIWYNSGKYEVTYNYILDSTGTETYGCGLVAPVFDCTRYTFSDTEGPCQTARRRTALALPSAVF